MNDAHLYHLFTDNQQEKNNTAGYSIQTDIIECGKSHDVWCAIEGCCK
jgi:hypothetical protein